METVETLITDGFWEAEEPLVTSGNESLRAWVRNQTRLRGHVLFETSGSTRQAKHVCLSRRALQHSAMMVNHHLQTTPADVWFRALPARHVGGFGVAARAALGGMASHYLNGDWDPMTFSQEIRRLGATLTALVPTQVYDLVAASLSSPPSLRAVLVGGGSLSPELEKRARGLGWPLLKTFGMTETASQIATQPLGGDAGAAMQILSGWEARTEPDTNLLCVRGPALFTGYALEMGASYHFIPRDGMNGWFTTSDHVELRRMKAGDLTLTFLGRSSQRLKIKGELVNLAPLRLELESLASRHGLDPTAVTLAAVAHPRDGQALILVAEARIPPAARDLLVEAYNAAAPGLLRVNRVLTVPEVPRTPLGKIEEAALQQALEALTTQKCLP